jgi:hypothetical protein
MIPSNLLDDEGYPTNEFLQFIKEYEPETMLIMEFIDVLKDGWYFGDWGFKLGRKYKGIRKLQLHTGGWSGNETTINEILGNFWLTHFYMKYVKWHAGGHYYFEIKV